MLCGSEMTIWEYFFDEKFKGEGRDTKWVLKECQILRLKFPENRELWDLAIYWLFSSWSFNNQLAGGLRLFILLI